MSRNGHSNGEAALAAVAYEAKLAASLARIAFGAADPRPSNDREAFRAMAAGWVDERGRHYRRVYCRWYGRCLDHAILAKWDGFTCRVCPVDAPIEGAERIAEDAVFARLQSIVEAGG